jgi:hypothetical protein
MKQKISAPVAIGVLTVSIVLILGVVIFLNRNDGIQGGNDTPPAGQTGNRPNNAAGQTLRQHTDPVSNIEEARQHGMPIPANAGR